MSDLLKVRIGGSSYLCKWEPDYRIIGGRKYKTTVIGNQEWLAENLDFKFCNVGGTLGVSTPNAWYYNNDEASYGIDGTYKCGLLYNWFALKYLEDNKSALCPGWHVPTEVEWNTLISMVGSNSAYKLKAKDDSVISGFPSGWQGNDNYEFTVLPGGYIYGNFYHVGSQTAYFTLTENTLNPSTAVIKLFTTGYDVLGNKYDKSYGFYVRLVRDAS